VNQIHASASVVGKRDHRLVPYVPPRLILLAGALLAGSLLAAFGSLLLEALRTTGR
jgi:hypothetical protein